MRVWAIRGVVVQVGRLEWRVETDLGHGHGEILAFAHWCVAWAGDHVFAFQTAAVDAAGKCAGAVPGRVEDVVAAFEIGRVAAAYRRFVIRL